MFWTNSHHISPQQTTHTHIYIYIYAFPCLPPPVILGYLCRYALVLLFCFLFTHDLTHLIVHKILYNTVFDIL